jgi:hypothetical protein
MLRTPGLEIPPEGCAPESVTARTNTSIRRKASIIARNEGKRDGYFS